MRRRSSFSPNGPRLWPARSREEVERVLTTPRSGGLLTFGAVFSFYFASSAIEALRVGLNRAYGLIEPRPWWMLQASVAGPGADRVDRPAGASLPRRARAADRGYARGLLSRRRAGAQPAHVPPHRRSPALMLASSLILAHIILPAHRVGFRDILPGVTMTFIASIAFGEAFRRLFERVFAQLHFDLRGPCLGHDRARLSLLGRAPVRVRRRVQCGDHQGAPDTAVRLTQRLSRA